MKKILVLIMAVMIVCTSFMFTGCTAADNVNHNLSQAADNFQVVRKITMLEQTLLLWKWKVI